MKISVVVVTSNRTNLLTKCLQSLVESAKSAYLKNLNVEFIIVFNGKDEKAASVVKDFLHGQQYKIFQLETSLYPGAARNFALDNLTGDWIFFADDDIYVEKEFFSTFQNIVSSREQYSVIGGPNLTPPESSAFQELSGHALASPFASFHCSQRYRVTQECSDVDDTALTLCNLFVKTEALGNLRFSNSLVCAEENSFLSFLEKKGHRFLANPGLKVFHERRDSWPAFARQVAKYGHGRGQLILRGDAQWFHFVPLACLILILFGPLFQATKTSILPLVAVYLFSLFCAVGTIIFNSNSSLRKVPVLSFLIVTIHFNYAIGISRGIIFELFNKVMRPEIR